MVSKCQCSDINARQPLEIQIPSCISYCSIEKKDSMTYLKEYLEDTLAVGTAIKCV